MDEDLTGFDFEKGLERFQQVLGYSFQDRSILEASLFHYLSHRRNERPIIAPRQVFERNEKLGDGLLKVAVQDLLAKKYLNITAGELTYRESIVTCNINLAHVAVRLQILKFFDHRNEFGFEKKALADTVEAILYGIALDAGDGDPLLGLPILRNVCDHIFKFELSSSQINRPHRKLIKEARATRTRIKIQYETTKYRGFVVGFVAKVSLRGTLAKKLGVDRFAGTGFSVESAREKASAAILLVLRPNLYPSELDSLSNFSWKIMKPK